MTDLIMLNPKQRMRCNNEDCEGRGVEWIVVYGLTDDQMELAVQCPGCSTMGEVIKKYKKKESKNV